MKKRKQALKMTSRRKNSKAAFLSILALSVFVLFVAGAARAAWQDGVWQVGSQARSIAVEVGDSYVEGVKDFGRSVETLGQTANNQFISAVGNVSSLVGQTLKDTGTVIKDFSLNVVNLGNGVSRGINTAGAAIGNQLSVVGQGVKSLNFSSFQSLGRDVSDFGFRTSDLTNEVGAVMGNYVNSVVSLGSTAGTRLQSAAGQLSAIGELPSAIGNQVSAVGDKISNFQFPVPDFKSFNLKSAVKSLAQDVKDLAVRVGDVPEFVGAKLQVLGSGLQEQVSELSGKVASLVGKEESAALLAESGKLAAETGEQKVEGGAIVVGSKTEEKPAVTNPKTIAKKLTDTAPPSTKTIVEKQVSTVIQTNELSRAQAQKLIEELIIQNRVITADKDGIASLTGLRVATLVDFTGADVKGLPATVVAPAAPAAANPTAPPPLQNVYNTFISSSPVSIQPVVGTIGGVSTDFSVGRNLSVASNAFVDSTLTVGTATTNGALTVIGSASISTTLGVTGATTLTGALTANGGATLGDASTDTLTINASTSSTAPMSISASSSAPMLFLTNTASVSSTDPKPALRIAGSVAGKNMDLFVDENGNGKIRTTFGGGGDIYMHPDGGDVYMQTNLIIGSSGNASIQASGRANFSYDPAVGAPSLWLSTSSTYPTYKTYIAVDPAETVNFDRFLHFSHGNNDRLIVGYDGDMLLNASSTYSGNLFTIRKEGSSRFYVDNSGNVLASGTITTGGHLYPATDNLYDIGASSTQWRYGNFQGGLLVADGTTTSTLANNSIISGQTSGYDLGKFYVDSSGNTNASGTLTLNSASSTVLSSNSLIIAKDSTKASGLFSVDSSGNVKTSGSLYSGSQIGWVNDSNTYIYQSSGDAFNFVIGGSLSQQFYAGVIYNDIYRSYGSNVVTLRGHTADSSTAVAVALNAGAAFTTAGAKIVSIQNNSVEKAFFDLNGELSIGGGTATSTLSSSTLKLAVSSSDALGKFYVDSSGNVTSSGTLAITGHFTPYTDNLYDIGASSTQWRYGNFQGGLLVADGTTTSTLSNNSLILGQTSGSNVGKFYVDSSGNVSASGSLLTYGNVTSTGILYATNGLIASASSTFSSNLFVNGDFKASSTLQATGDLTIYGNTTLGDVAGDTITVNGRLSTINISDGSTTSSLAKNSFYIAADSSNALGKFYVDSSGNTNTSGTLAITGHFTPYTDNTYDIGASSTQWRYGNFQGGLSVADGTTTSTLSNNSLILGQTSGSNLGKFYVDSSGNLTVSGSVWLTNTTVPSAVSLRLGGDGNSTTTLTHGYGTTSTIHRDAGFVLGDGAFSYGASSTITSVSSLETTNLNFPDDAGLVTWTNLQITTTTASIENGYSATINDYPVFTVYGLSNTAGTASNLGLMVASSSAPYTDFSVNNLFTIASSTGNTNTSGTLRVYGGASTGGLLISSTNTTTTLTSYVSGNGVGAFVLDTNTLFSPASSTVLLSVRNGGNKVFSISNDGYVASTGTFNANVASTGIGDVAEYVNLTPGESAEPGDVLVVSKDTPNKYKKSSAAYTKEIAGVVSDTGAFIIGASGEGRAPLALAGLVKVKVSIENGSIAVGDYLVSSAKPGYAMKYDPLNPPAGGAGLVGMALEPATEDGRITIMVNKGLLDGAAVTNLNVTQNAAGQLIGAADLNLAGYNILNVKGITSAGGKWSIDEEGRFISKDIKADKAQVKQMVVEKDAAANKSTVGEATIPANQTSILIYNETVSSTAKIFITFRNNPKAFWWISRQEDGLFEVSLSQSASEDVTFDYWLVGVAISSDTVILPPTGGTPTSPVGATDNPSLSPVIPPESASGGGVEESSPIAPPATPPATVIPPAEPAGAPAPNGGASGPEAGPTQVEESLQSPQP